MRRLLGLLLALLLAIPAMQTSAHRAVPATGPAMHDMAMPGMTPDMAGHHRHHGDGSPAPANAVHHDCIGCIAPIDVRLYRPAAAPHPVTARGDPPADMAFRLARASAPEPPPPRPAA